MEFKNYLKAVGTGPKGNRDLTFEESDEMMTDLLTKDLPHELISAFLIGWRLKPETILEYQGSLGAIDKLLKPFQRKIENSLELGFPFDGKNSNPYLFPLVAKLLSTQHLNLIVMGDDRIPSKEGVTVKDIFEKTKFDDNVTYFDRKIYLNSLHQLTQLRNYLGLRTAFNTIEKLPRLGLSEFAVTGVFHRPYVQKYNDIFRGRYKRFALVQGNEGSPELIGKAKIWITEGETTTEYFVDPGTYGINFEKKEIYTLEEFISFIKNPSTEILKLARLNAAIYLFLCQKVDSIDKGYELLS